MTPKQVRRLRRQFDEQLRLERNGAPTEELYPEIHARMTKPKVEEPPWQVWVVDKERGFIPAGPMGPRGWAEEYASVINQMVLAGREKQWRAAQAMPMIAR